MCCRVSLPEDVARGMPIPKQHRRMRQSRGTWGGEAGSNPSSLLCPPPIAATSARPLSQGLLCQSRFQVRGNLCSQGPERRCCLPTCRAACRRGKPRARPRPGAPRPAAWWSVSGRIARRRRRALARRAVAGSVRCAIASVAPKLRGWDCLPVVGLLSLPSHGCVAVGRSTLAELTRLTAPRMTMQRQCAARPFVLCLSVLLVRGLCLSLSPFPWAGVTHLVG